MTKRYRLLKDYPGAEAGDIYELDRLWLDNKSRIAITVELGWLKTHSDYFEEIKEQEWEILAFLSGQTEFRKERNNVWRSDIGWCTYSYEELLKIAKIHSVSRNSDQQVFSIGDEVDIQEYNETGTIACFKLEDSRMIALLRPVLDRNGKLNTYHISYLQKSKPKEEQPFQWSDELALDAIETISKRFAYPDEFNGGVWEGIEKEVAKWKLFTKQQTNTIPSAYDSKLIKEYYDSESPTKSQPKTNSIEEDGFEDLKKWVNQHQNVKWVSDLTFSFIYQNKQCHGMITYLPYHFEITIRSVSSTDDIGNGCGFAVYKKFPRKVESQPKTERTYTEKELKEAEEKWFNIGIGHIISGVKSYKEYKKQKP